MEDVVLFEQPPCRSTSQIVGQVEPCVSGLPPSLVFYMCGIQRKGCGAALEGVTLHVLLIKTNHPEKVPFGGQISISSKGHALGSQAWSSAAS